MAHFIIHKDGVYNVWSTVVDAPIFDSGMTLEQLQSYIKDEHGQVGLHALPERLVRAHATGSSGIMDSLDACIAVNRAGAKETCLSRDEFIGKYLTLPAALPDLLLRRDEQKGGSK